MNEQEINQVANDIAYGVTAGMVFDENYGNLPCGLVKLLFDRIANVAANRLRSMFVKPAEAATEEVPANNNE